MDFEKLLKGKKQVSIELVFKGININFNGNLDITSEKIIVFASNNKFIISIDEIESMDKENYPQNNMIKLKLFMKNEQVIILNYQEYQY